MKFCECCSSVLKLVLVDALAESGSIILGAKVKLFVLLDAWVT